MKRKSGLVLGFVGVFALTIGSTDVLAKGHTDVSDGDKYKVVTVEEQEVRENKGIEGRDLTTVITVEEQNMVEDSLDLEGFVPQEDGTGFWYKKENSVLKKRPYEQKIIIMESIDDPLPPEAKNVQSMLDKSEPQQFPNADLSKPIVITKMPVIDSKTSDVNE